MLNDLRYCFRTLMKSPGLTAVAILSLGLGIGLNLTVFGIFESMFVRGITAADPGHTFHVWTGGSNRTSYPNYVDLRRSGAVPVLAAYSLMPFTIGEGDRRDKIFGQTVAGDYFEMLGVQPVLGRGFTAEEKQPERGLRAVLISYPFWKKRFGGEAAVLGKALRLNGQMFPIVGVLPEGYRSIHGFAAEPPFYVPYSSAVDPAYSDRSEHPLELAARTAPGQSREQAEAALLATAKALERAYPKENRNFGQVRVFGISVFDQIQRGGGAQQALLFFAILSVVVGLILLLACANVAGLLVGRAIHRRREVAVRLAIGGTRGRLVRLFVTESLLLSAAGLGAAALLYCWALAAAARVPIPTEVPFYLRPELNWRVALYAAAAALASALFCSVASVLEACKGNVSAALKNGTEAGERGRFFSLRNNLVIGQVAISLVLLVMSMLFLRSLRAVQTMSPGFNVENQVLASIRLDEAARPESMKQAAKLAMERLAGMPGVQSVAAAALLPLSHNIWMTKVAIGSDAKLQPVVQANAVSARYFATMGIPVLGGREFTPADRVGTPAIAVVNQAFAKQYFAGTAPLGQVLIVPKGPAAERVVWQIVGIVADSKHESLGEGPTPVLYRPLEQEDLPIPPTIHVRTEQPAVAIVPAVRAAITAAFPAAVVNVTTMRENVQASTYPNQIGAALLGGMGTLGLLLASVGLYGVLAYAVTRRTREIGVRMALGASSQEVLRIVLGQSMALAAIGVAIGLGLSLVATKPLATFLSDGVSVTDPFTLAAVAGVLTATALAAGLVPAVRALRVDPVSALRCD